MSEAQEAAYRITLEESLAFAELSGDFNPLHVDPVAARRTQFGGTVVHGIHAALKAADLLAGTWLDPGHLPVAINVSFNNPIRSGDEVVARATRGVDGKVRIAATAAGRPAFTMTLRADAAVPESAPVPDGRPPRAAARPRTFPPADTEGSAALQLDRELLARLLPRLARCLDLAWVADLLASTRIVGMDCPGLDSIYSGLKLTRRTAVADGPPRAMSYRVEKMDPRFRLARLSVEGRHFEGSLDTFFRPPAVPQRALADVAGLVDGNAFAGQIALVVGGSRGLGETAAKVLMAGGAEVTVTYARGADDARRVADEAGSLGLRCGLRRLDLSTPIPAEALGWLGSAGFTHVYFFASPHIEKTAPGRWNQVLFDRLAAVYLRGFSEVLGAIAGGARAATPIRVLYPSTVFLDSHEAGFAEYCAAKAAGEELARHLAEALGVTVAVPRLPRVRTDQTIGLVESEMAETLPVMLDILRGFAR